MERLSFFINITFPMKVKDMDLKAKKVALFIENLFGFENLLDLVDNVSFHKRKKNHFQRHLDYVVKDINKSENVKSDKTANFYKLPRITIL